MMKTQDKNILRQFIQARLEENGDHAALDDNGSLFLSARLDSLNLADLVMFLEKEFHADFSDVYFEVEMLDSVYAIEALLDQQAG